MDDATQGDGFDSDDEELRNIDQALPQDHVLMQRIQGALQNQLQKQRDRLILQLREKMESVSASKKKRETIGVELYSFQQALATLQVQLQKSHDKLAETAQMRTAAEQDLRTAHSSLSDQQKQKDELDRKRVAVQRELDKLNVQVQQVEEYNEKVKSEIMVTRRAAYGTEEAMQRAEKEKRRQDDMIDQLNEQIKNAAEQIRLFEAQITAQKEQTVSAQATLKEAMKEIEVINVEKREFLQKWKSSLIGMANRDAALQASEAALLEQKEELQSLMIQIKGLKAAIKDERSENERLTGMVGRSEAEAKIIDNQLIAARETKRELQQKYSMLRSNMDRVDKDLKAAKQEQKEIQTDIDSLGKKYERLITDKQKVDDNILENVSDRQNVRKGAQNVEKSIQKLRQQIHVKELEIGQLQNEIARIKVDSLNTGAHNKELKTTLEAYENELKEKEKLVEKYEQEIRQRHDKVEKKQIYIARLNRKYEQLTAGQEEENTGPLEATIKNLTKEIISETKQSQDRQREWIKIQTDLVSLVGETNAQAEKLQELQSKASVLESRRMRLNLQCKRQRDETKEVEDGIRAMQVELIKLNEMISKNTKLMEDLANTTYTMETDFARKLRELEMNSVQMDASIAKLKQMKEDTFQEIVEVEKQIVLWEKKIQLEKETQEALDPEYGQSEIKGMKKEIHRMQLRLTKLKLQQERLTQEMERTIEKREIIRIGVGSAVSSSPSSSSPSSSSSSSGPDPQRALTKAALHKKIAGLKATLKSQVEESKKLVQEIAKHEEQNESLESELANRQAEYSQIEDRKLDVDRKIQDAYLTKQLNLEQVMMYQRRAKQYEEMAVGKFKLAGPKDRIRSDLQREEEMYQRIKAAVDRLKSENPKHESFFQKLLEYF